MAGGGNWEFQVYWNNRTNSYTRDSVLYNVHQANPYFGQVWRGFCAFGRAGCVASARMRTVGHFGFRYGIVEARVQVPQGDWIWPAIWMQPVREAYGLWPASGEIDIMESRGHLNLVRDGVNIRAEQYSATLRYGLNNLYNGWLKTHFEKNTEPGQGWNTDFHLYQVE